jgi:hypothetical protein
VSTEAKESRRRNGGEEVVSASQSFTIIFITSTDQVSSLFFSLTLFQLISVFCTVQQHAWISARVLLNPAQHKKNNKKNK